MPRKPLPKTKSVTWLSEEIPDLQSLSSNFIHYQKFQFDKIVAQIGDFVLISNADAAEPDTEEGCDAARILSLYEDTSNNKDPFRAKVQWYSKPNDLPTWCFNNMEPISFCDREVIEDHRPFVTDVSIETFFRKCTIVLEYTRNINETVKTTPYNYICRYRLIALSKRKVQVEPVLEEERQALQLLSTPCKALSNPRQTTPKTPSSLVKRMGRISLSEQKNWSISKSDGTKLLLKRAILADKSEKDSPNKVTTKPVPKILIPDILKSSTILSKINKEDLLTMELKENSDDELPTLIIRQHVPTTPKRKQSISKTTNDTPRKTLVFDEGEKDTHVSLSGRVTKKPVNYMEKELSPVKRTPTRSGRLPKYPVGYEKEGWSPPKRTPTRLTPLSKNTVNYREEELSPVKHTPTRSERVSRNPISYMEDEISPVKRTPKKLICKMDLDDDNDFKVITKTPKTPKTPRTPRAMTARTPSRSVSKKIQTSQLTPTLRTRTHSVDNIDDFIKDNKSLPGRENQMDEILSFVRSKLLDGSSGCMYISGVPGTGKTATVCSSLKILKEEIDLPDFQLVEVNGMRIAEPRQAYVQIYKQLTGKSVVWEQACSLLEKRFTNPGPRRIPTVLLVDELDALCTRRQDVLYSIMEWAAHKCALLTVLAVANTMDLPERALAARVASRLGLTRLTFPPYTHTQLQTIVATRLAGANVTADAVQLIARKVAAVSGDARRALALCSRALELARANPSGAAAGLKEVQQALAEAASTAAVRAIRNCSPAERLMLRAVAAEVERTGSDETTLSRALATAAAIVALDGRPYKSATSTRAPTPSQAQAICSRLASIRLLLLEPKPAEPRLLLNVSADDVHYATNQITV